MPKKPITRTPDPDEPQVPKNAVPKKVPVKPKNGKPKPPKAIPGAPFQPVTLMPMSDVAILNNLMASDIKNSTEPLLPPSPTLKIMDVLVNGMTKGDNIEPIRLDIERISNNQVEKAALMQALENQLSMERSVMLHEMRFNAERVLHRASKNGKMTTAEALAVWRISQEGIVDGRTQQAKAKPVDTVTVVNKVDIHQHQQDLAAAERFQGTTPQGREIIRKKLYELKKKVDRIYADADAEEAAEQEQEQQPPPTLPIST